MVLSPQPESSDLATDLGNVSPITVDAHDVNSANLDFMHHHGRPEGHVEEDEEPFMRMEQVRGKYCTTSTVYAEHTIVNPNYDQVIFCIAAIIQAQIFEDWSFSDEVKARYPEYNLEIKLPPEFGGKLESIPDSVLAHETMNDAELREKIISGDVPTIDTIFRFINLLYQNAKYSPECNIISLIYLNRLTSSGKIPLTMANWRGIWLSGIVLAQKVWDDVPLRTSQFNQILPSVSKSVLRDLERRTLNLIEFTTNVKPSLYAKYYFELRTLFSDITGNDSLYQWNLKPLTILEAKQLDMRTKRSVLEIRGARANGDPSVITSPQKLRLTPVPTRSVVTSVSGIAGGNTARSNTRNVRLLPMSGELIKTNHTLEDFQRIDTTRYVLS